MLNIAPNIVSNELAKLFPNASCELDYRNVYELSVAVILSAQTTDKSVNKVTPKLFEKYPDLDHLASANIQDVERIIQAIGLYKRKSIYIIEFARFIINEYHGIIPNTIEQLIKVPGIGRKTANVIVSEGYKLPGFAVDVHVTRVSNRLGLVNTTDPNKIEMILKELFPKDEWHIMHHRLIFMGRYLCKAQKPECNRCPFINKCLYDKKS